MIKTDIFLIGILVGMCIYGIMDIIGVYYKKTKK